MDPLQNKRGGSLVQQRDWNSLKVLAIEFGLYFKKKKPRKKGREGERDGGRQRRREEGR